ncbi:MAG TPA: sialate O-acetylesterase [Burkholderiales bacterium]|jgi:hypothetical protein|nr:sialate O-acetylesterase [Burkholderiales bacterium]
MPKIRHAFLLALAAMTGGVAGFVAGIGLDSRQEQAGSGIGMERVRRMLAIPAADKADVEKYNAFGQLIYWPGKRAVPRPEITASTIIAVVFGQSNAGNHGGQRTDAADAAVLNYSEGKFFEARDPLLGSSGIGGSPWPLMAKHLLAAKAADRVLLLPAAIAGSSVADWSRGHPLYRMLEQRLNAARADGLQVTHFLWHQGEEDNGAGGYRRVTPAQYAAGMRELIGLTKSIFPKSRFFVAIATRCGAAFPVDQKLRAVQIDLQKIDGVFAGPDTDAIYGTFDRFDDCHFSATGLANHGAAWAAALTSPSAPAAPK